MFRFSLRTLFIAFTVAIVLMLPLMFVITVYQIKNAVKSPHRGTIRPIDPTTAPANPASNTYQPTTLMTVVGK